MAAVATSKPRAQDIDKHIGVRLRERRLALGLTQGQLAELAGVTAQQERKYEAGSNRITTGRLYRIAQALNVEVSYFVQGMDAEETFRPNSQQRMALDLARNFTRISSRHYQEAICMIARAMVDVELP